MGFSMKFTIQLVGYPHLWKSHMWKWDQDLGSPSLWDLATFRWSKSLIYTKKNKKHRTHKEHFTSNFVRVIQTKGKTLSMPVVCWSVQISIAAKSSFIMELNHRTLGLRQSIIQNSAPVHCSNAACQIMFFFSLCLMSQVGCISSQIVTLISTCGISGHWFSMIQCFKIVNCPALDMGPVGQVREHRITLLNTPE